MSEDDLKPIDKEIKEIVERLRILRRLSPVAE